MDCALNGGSQVQWWNGTAWVPVSAQTYNATTGCVTITVGTVGGLPTSPTLGQLAGTRFGASGAATLTITASSPTMSYGGTVPAITPSFSGFVNGDTSAAVSGLTCSTTATAGSPPGSYPTSCSGGSATNYTISYVAGTLTIGKAPLTITASSPTMAYGGTAPTITPSYSGFVNGDTGAAVSGLTCSTTATSSKPAGSYPTSCSGGSAANYTISYVGGTLAIGKATLTITASSPEHDLRGHGAAITPSFSGFVNGDTGAAVSGLTCSATATASSPLGSYPTSCSGGSAANYTISYVGGTLTIGKAPLTITASSPSMSYGGHGARHHAQLQRLRQRGHRRRGERAHLQQHRHRKQPARELSDHLLGGSSHQLHHQLRCRHADHRQGDADDHGEQPQHELRRHGAVDHAEL